MNLLLLVQKTVLTSKLSSIILGITCFWTTSNLWAAMSSQQHHVVGKSDVAAESLVQAKHFEDHQSMFHGNWTSLIYPKETAKCKRTHCSWAGFYVTPINVPSAEESYATLLHGLLVLTACLSWPMNVDRLRLDKLQTNKCDLTPYAHVEKATLDPVHQITAALTYLWCR